MAEQGTVVELRVHGVSGTPPEVMLGTSADAIARVAGDDQAGFYRRRDDPPSASPSGWNRVMEAYSWGGLTSGRASRAVWLLVLPFILIDLAPWMLPPVTGRRRTAAIAVGLLRLLALSYTLTLLLAAAVALLDVSVWQCANLDGCAVDALLPLADRSRGVQLMIGALPLVAMIGVLWWLGRETLRVAAAPPDPAVLRDEVPLASPRFWDTDNSVLRLRACHVTAWAAGLSALVAAAPTRYAGSAAGRWAGAGLLAADAIILAVAIAATAWNATTARGGTGADRATRPLLWLRWLSLGVLAATLVWVSLVDAGYPAPPTHLPGLRGAIYGLLLVQVVLLVALLAAVLWCRCGGPAEPAGYSATLRGTTAWFVAVLAWLIGGGFSVGVGLWFAEALGTVVLSTEKAAATMAATPLIMPPPYVWAAIAIAALIVVAAGLAGRLWWVVRQRTRRETKVVLDDYPGADASDVRVRQVARARALASIADLAPAVVAGLTAVALTVIAAMAVWYFSDRGGFEALPAAAPAVATISVLVTVVLVSALGGLVAAAYRYRQLRRTVAVLWDVVCFWPRANHPLTPPCYGERAVPELLDRLASLVRGERSDGECVGDTRQRAVLAAHSQGSIIAAAALLRDGALRDGASEATGDVTGASEATGDVTGASEATGSFPGSDLGDKVGLLTFGCPLRRLYARNFPAYFGPTALHRLHSRQPDWIDLWAFSDPIGGWVLAEAGPVDRRLLDVLLLADAPGGICAHSGFWTRPEYDAAVRDLERALGAVPDPSATAQPTEQGL